VWLNLDSGFHIQVSSLFTSMHMHNKRNYSVVSIVAE
jgi:hypothetical protein